MLYNRRGERNTSIMFDSSRTRPTHRESCPEGARVADSRRRGERQSRKTDGQDEAPQHHLGHPEGQHDPGAGPVLPQPGQAAGQRGGTQGTRAPADASAASAARQRVQRHRQWVMQQQQQQ